MSPKPAFLLVKPEQQYGKTVLIPQNEVAKALATIAKSKTITPDVLRLATESLGLGLKIVEVSNTDRVRALMYPKANLQATA